MQDSTRKLLQLEFCTSLIELSITKKIKTEFNISSSQLYFYEKIILISISECIKISLNYIILLSFNSLLEFVYLLLEYFYKY